MFDCFESKTEKQILSMKLNSAVFSKEVTDRKIIF